MTDLANNLRPALQSISELLSTLSADDWQRPQAGKWTVAEEVDHLLLSTKGTAFVLSPAARPKWHEYTGGSRSFETIVHEYQAALQANPGVVNAATAPTEAANQLTIDEQMANWKAAAQKLQAVVNGLDVDLDAYTVWKHPLLGPLTIWEMIYFTQYHTEHHYQSLLRKQSATDDN
jgi:hypothetical protein